MTIFDMQLIFRKYIFFIKKKQSDIIYFQILCMHYKHFGFFFVVKFQMFKGIFKQRKVIKWQIFFGIKRVILKTIEKHISTYLILSIYQLPQTVNEIEIS